MHETKLAYLREIKPGPHPDGRALLRKGIEMGRSFQAGKSRFIRESGHASYLEYKKKCIREGRITWNILLGLATLEEQVAGIKKLHEFMQRTGLVIDTIQPIPSGRIALPKEYRDKAPPTTSYMMDGFEDYKVQVEAAPIEVTFNDYHLASPNGLATTRHALEAGAALIGEFSQIIWGYPGFDDDARRFSDMMLSLGMMASKADEGFAVKTYLDDGLPGYFIDCASYVGYAILEHYICTKLCGARYVIAYGGLLSECDTRVGIAMALHALLSTEEQPVLHYANSSTNLQWDHDVHGNYGVSVPEFLFEILAERKYRMGLGVNPVSITEKIAVPTLDDLMNIFVAGKRAEEKASEWDRFMDFGPLERMRDVMVEQGKAFFENVLSGLAAAGVDVEDPLELILVLRNFNPMKFEMTFHPSTANTERKEVEPFFPTVLGKQTVHMREEIVAGLRRSGLARPLEGRKVIVASGDCHTYGLLLVEGVLRAMGASVVNGGVDMDPIHLLDLADEEDTASVCVSCHNGQALGYGKQLVALARERGKPYAMFMGGKLNAILPGSSEPVDVSGQLKDLGIFADNDLQGVVSRLAAAKPS
jgi:hypothetical protein